MYLLVFLIGFMHQISGRNTEISNCGNEPSGCIKCWLFLE